MPTTPTTAARRAVKRLADLEQRVIAAREDRDDAIVAMFDSGLRPAQIARDLGMTDPNVRLILKVAGRIGAGAQR
jgi:hypothetical protein